MTTLLAFVFVLGVLVFVHEAGHFATAKWLGVKVKVFSLGFPPKLFSRTWGETEYQIGALPLGGYVKMAGDNPMEASGDPDEFMSRSKWERLAILFAGPLMNLVLAVFILTFLFLVGVERPAGLEDSPVVRFVADNSPASRADVKPGDLIIAIDGAPVETWSEALDKFIISANETLSVSLVRNERTIQHDLTMESRGEDAVGYSGLFPTVQPQIGKLMQGFPAASAGLKTGDIITKVAGNSIFHFTELVEKIESSQGLPVSIGVLRGDQNLTFELIPKKEGDRWLIGIEFNPAPTVLHRIENPILAFGAALDETKRFTGLTIAVLGRLVTGRASIRTLSGPVGIAGVAGETARRGFRQLFMFMAFLSLNLGILNLLPVPLLDGGHMAIIVVEGLAGRDLSVAVKERILQVGFVMLFMLMVTVLLVDLSKIEAISKYLPW